MLNKTHQAELIALLIIFILFFLQFLNLLKLDWAVNLANSWKVKNYQFLQMFNRPLQRMVSMWKLTARLEDLQYRYSEAAARVAKIQVLEAENQELRKLLENSDRSYQKVIVTAPVISFAQSFVQAGAQAGVKLGSAVLYKDTLLGLVDQVEEKQSSVLLLSKLNDSYLLAETENGVKGIIKGNGKEVLFTELKQDDPISLGQLVFTASQVSIEKGLLIGRVARIVEENPALAVKTAVIEQLVDFYEASLVEIR